jgi:hypothetical protein
VLAVLRDFAFGREKDPGMTKLVVDAALEAKLTGVEEPVELCDRSGRTLGYFHPLVPSPDSTIAAVRSPLSDEEIERRRQDPEGRPLREILADLERR